MSNKNTKLRNFGRKRRGVGAIIGGVILAGIILTSVLTFFVTILQNETARTSYEIQSQTQNKDKDIETFIVDRDLTVAAGVVNLNINNTGSIPMVASHVLAYCSTCANPGIPIQDQTLSTVLNPGDTVPVTVTGLSTTGETYTISAISERGNIISSTTCTLQADGSCSEDSDACPGCVTEDELDGRVTEGIIQGTGSVQLDYKAFGAIYQEFGTRDGIAQRGWEIMTGSNYSSVHGYPGFDIMSNADVVFVENMRNLDTDGNDLTLARSTSLLTNIGKEPSGQPDIEYICKENTVSKTLAAYDETTANKILTATAIDAELDEGWHEVYFCSQTPASATIDYHPRNTFNIFHPLFMVIRGTFSNSLQDYGQTIPYQSTLGGLTSYSSFNSCLRDDSASPGASTACVSPDSNDATASLNYHATATTIKTTAGGYKLWVHTNGATASSTKITVTWIYPDGTHTVLANAVTVNAQKNVQIILPVVNSDGTALSCSGGAGTSDYHVIKTNDPFDSGGQRNVHYMTYRVDC